MDDLTQKSAAPQPVNETEVDQEASEMERRELLKRLGKLVVYTAPAIVAVLASSQTCLAVS